MPTASILKNFSMPGISVTGSFQLTATGGLPSQEVPLPAGTAGTVTGASEVTAAGHPLSTNDIVDVYWTDGVRFGCTATVDGDVITLADGAGDALPASTTPIVVTEQVVIQLEFDSDNLVCIAAVADQRAHVEFHDAVTTSILGVEIPVAGEAWSWIEDSGYADPFGSDVVEEARASNGTVTAATLKMGGLYNSTA